MDNTLIPVKGAWVKDCKTDNLGVVVDSEKNQFGTRNLVYWFHSRESSWIGVDQVGCGFRKGMDVVDVPYSRIRKSLGSGSIIDLRKIGSREQALVEFPEFGQRIWLPYENLRHVKGVRHRFLTAETGKRQDVERFRMKSLAYALELWNENTGSLSHLDIDPLPHQIHLVHHILASGNLNWLIADDVGLGKTIEVGMLLSALRQRKKLGRVLLITPAGLTKQWQDELRYKFGMDEFQIYGEDFQINDAHYWKLRDYVIGSIDRLKDEQHLDLLLQAEPWDLIIFDEAHRLSRRQYGMKFDASQRFRLAAELRKRTDSILLLSATPHQGLTDKFQALLEVLRPEWKQDIRRIEQSPEFLRHMIIRNHKADVTDADGNFIFLGKVTKAVKVNTGIEARSFDAALQNYLKQGYTAGFSRGQKGQAIGFVMTTYRKLAASSSAAILTALEKRLARLSSYDGSQIEHQEYTDLTEGDIRFEGEYIEQAGLFDPVFFDGEISLLKDLIVKARALVDNDKKVESFIDGIIPSIHEINPQEKILIFSEYRSTQSHLATVLIEKYGDASVEMINGSMKHQDRQEAIARFEDSALFLLSTEAGGEGINLQKKCHVMVNYDLPWNPMRLVQRIGRLYRYGQKHKVAVFNIHAPNTLDEEIMGLMYERISAVVKDMAEVSEDFRAGLEDDILGEIAELIDIKEVLDSLPQHGIAHTKEKIEEALRKAREASEKQRELFDYTSSFDPNETKNELNISGEHLSIFVRGMLRILNIDILNETHNSTVLQIRIPDELMEEIKGVRQRMTITFDRLQAASRNNVQMMDLESSLMKYLLHVAKEHDFGGLIASSSGLDGQSLLTGVLRWQNDQGKCMRQEYCAFMARKDGEVELNPAAFGDWLKTTPNYVEVTPEKNEVGAMFANLDSSADQRLAQVSNRDLHPEGKQWISSLWLKS